MYVNGSSLIMRNPKWKMDDHRTKNNFMIISMVATSKYSRVLPYRNWDSKPDVTYFMRVKLHGLFLFGTVRVEKPPPLVLSQITLLNKDQ